MVTVTGCATATSAASPPPNTTADNTRLIFAGPRAELTARLATSSAVLVASWSLGIQARPGGVDTVPELSEQVLRWVTDAVGGGVRVAAVTGLREGANPWSLRFE